MSVATALAEMVFSQILRKAILDNSGNSVLLLVSVSTNPQFHTLENNGFCLCFFLELGFLLLWPLVIFQIIPILIFKMFATGIFII